MVGRKIRLMAMASWFTWTVISTRVNGSMTRQRATAYICTQTGPGMKVSGKMTNSTGRVRKLGAVGLVMKAISGMARSVVSDS